MDRCTVHDEELMDTHPADVENGPHPSDVENRKVCRACEEELYVAYNTSMCLAHRTPLFACEQCWLEEDKS